VLVDYSLALVALAIGELFGDLVGADAALEGGGQAGGGSTIDIFVKDMGLVTEAARAKAYPTLLASAA
jgi:hypothetical protein